MPLRTSIPQDELRQKLTAQELEQQSTDYSANRGGHYPTQPKPVPTASRPTQQ